MINSDLAPVALGCGPLEITSSTAPTTYTGNVGFFGSGDPIADAEIVLYDSAAFDTPIATATSAADATYSLTYPAGTPDLLWGSVGGPGALTTYRHALRPDWSLGDVADYNLRIFTPENIEGAAVLVEERWDETTAVAAGFALDCDLRVVQHAAVTLSSTSGSRTFVDGASVYYGAPGAVAIAVSPEERGDTNDNGIFAVFRIPPGDGLYLQTWGFPDEAAMAEGEAGLVLVGEAPVHGVADSVIQIEIWANQD
jgi:hypothetical protein